MVGSVPVGRIVADVQVGGDGRVLPSAIGPNPGAVWCGRLCSAQSRGHEKRPQTGDVQIGDDVEIGANSCVTAPGHHAVRRHAKLDNLVQVGHAADVGEGALMVAYSGVAAARADLGSFLPPGRCFGSS